MSDRRRVWITGIGIVSRHRHRARRLPGRPASRALAHPAHRPLRSRPVPVAGRGTGRRLRPARPGCRPRPPASSTASASSAWSRAAWLSRMPASRPGANGAADPDRIGIYLGSALGGIAYAEEQHERYLERGIRSVAPNLALAVFGGAAPANLGIALGVRGPILSTANSCASGAVALGEALGRSARRPSRCRHRRRLRDPAQPARLRGVRHHPRPVARPQRRPGDAARPFDARRATGS